MHVTCVQSDITWEDKAATHAAVRAMLEAAPPPQGSLIVLPEMFSTGFSMNLEAIAEGRQRSTERFMAELARQYGCGVLGGVVNRNADGMGRNEALAIGPEGAELARYHKIHPFSFGREAESYAPGGEVVTFAWSDTVIAPFVCYDLRFPEVFRHAALRGAEVMVVIACWPAVRQEHWAALLRARAIENQAFVVAVNRIGRDPKLEYAGRSTVIDPRGEVLAEADDQPRTFGLELDLPDLRQYREQFPALADIHRRYLGAEGVEAATG